ncbi:hypothetical protein Tco_1053643 [Tanacetum coccineum]|uniref:Xylulose kinase-1 n=1 Tax=Tanacetum coccineum TaxID=301880 RepID=A0ABQ5GVR2_9ASTR
MSSPKFAEMHNVVAFLEKPKESDGFAEIIDFLKASSIHYALTVNPIIYTPCIKQFWATAKVQTVNEVRQLQALVDKKRVIVTESIIRKDLHLDDAEGTDCLPTATIFEELARIGAKSTAWNEFSSSMASLIICLPTNQKFNLSMYIFDAMVKHLDEGVKFSIIIPLFDTMMVQVSEEVGLEAEVPQDETEHEESVPTPSNDPQPSGEDSMQLTDLMVLCTKLQTQVLDLEKAKDAQAKEIAALKKRIQRLERKKMSRPTGLKRLKKVGMSRRVESSKDQESLGAPEDASKQGRSIADIDVDVEVTLVGETQERQDDELITASKAVSTASVKDSAAPTTIEEITLAQTLIHIKAAKPKVVTIVAATTTITTRPKARGVVVQEPSEFRVPQETQPSSSKDKGKGIMIEPKVPLKRKDQISLDEQIARDIQAKLDAELIEAKKRKVKKQKVEKEKESDEVDEVELRKILVIKKDEDIAIDAIPLATNSKRLLSDTDAIRIDREDLEALWRIVKAKYGDTRPENEFERVLWGDLKALKGLKSSCGDFRIAKPWITCVNTNRNTTLNEAHGVSLRITSSVRVSMISGTVCHVLYLGKKAYIEREIMGNHPEDNFTQLETIRRYNSTFGKKIPFELEREAFELERRISAAVACSHGGDGSGDDLSRPLHVRLAPVADAEKQPGEAEEAVEMEEGRVYANKPGSSGLRNAWMNIDSKRPFLSITIKERCYMSGKTLRGGVTLLESSSGSSRCTTLPGTPSRSPIGRTSWDGSCKTKTWCPKCAPSYGLTSRRESSSISPRFTPTTSPT